VAPLQSTPFWISAAGEVARLLKRNPRQVNSLALVAGYVPPLDKHQKYRTGFAAVFATGPLQGRRAGQVLPLPLALISIGEDLVEEPLEGLTPGKGIAVRALAAHAQPRAAVVRNAGPTYAFGSLPLPASISFH
jgi:hypothetical protein